MMRGPREAGKAKALKAIDGIANVAAIFLAFLLGPYLYDWTIGWAQSFVSSNYGYGLEGIVSFGWGCLCGAVVYYVAQASVAVLITMVFGSIIVRFL